MLFICVCIYICGKYTMNLDHFRTETHQFPHLFAWQEDVEFQPSRLRQKHQRGDVCGFPVVRRSDADCDAPTEVIVYL